MRRHRHYVNAALRISRTGVSFGERNCHFALSKEAWIMALRLIGEQALHERSISFLQPCRKECMAFSSDSMARERIMPRRVFFASLLAGAENGRAGTSRRFSFARAA